MADFKDRIEKLPPEKRALLEQLLMQKRAGAQSSSRIPKRSDSGPAPLSFAQQRLWFLDQWEPGAPTYNAAVGMTLEGPLDIAAMRKTLDSMVERHEILRTTYDVVDGTPRQIVHPAGPACTRVLDAGRLPEDKRRATIDRLLREECRKSFDLSKDPVMRTLLLRVAPNEHILLVVAHHIACDGWTRGILFYEISKWYAFHTAGTPHNLPALSIQYSDYAAWERETFQGAKMNAQAAFWRKELAGCPAYIDLPLDKDRPPSQVHAGAHHPFQLPRQTAAELQAITRHGGTTLFITCLAAFNVLLWALSNQDDLLVGTPIAHRGRLEIEPLMGFFANTLVMRTRLSGNPGFQELIERVKATALDAYSHQETPFEKLVEELRPPRDLSRNPLFQVNFRVRANAEPDVALPGINVRYLDLDIGTSKFDMALELRADAEGIDGYFEYNTALFELPTIERICAEFTILAGELVSNPAAPVADLPAFRRIRQELRRPKTPDAA